MSATTLVGVPRRIRSVSEQGGKVKVAEQARSLLKSAKVHKSKYEYPECFIQIYQCILRFLNILSKLPIFTAQCLRMCNECLIIFSPVYTYCCIPLATACRVQCCVLATETRVPWLPVRTLRTPGTWRGRARGLSSRHPPDCEPLVRFPTLLQDVRPWSGRGPRALSEQSAIPRCIAD